MWAQSTWACEYQSWSPLRPNLEAGYHIISRNIRYLCAIHLPSVIDFHCFLCFLLWGTTFLTRLCQQGSACDLDSANELWCEKQKDAEGTHPPAWVVGDIRMSRAEILSVSSQTLYPCASHSPWGRGATLISAVAPKPSWSFTDSNNILNCRS